jgi:hypothetical protein
MEVVRVAEMKDDIEREMCHTGLNWLWCYEMGALEGMVLQLGV